MSTIFGVPVDAAYYVVSTLAAALTPLTGGLAVAVAIVVSTVAVRLLLLPLSYYALRGQVAQSRLAPHLQALRQRHRGAPDRLTREARALYRDHGISMSAGYLPLLLQWPLLSVMYLLFRSGTVGGAPNTLLRHHLFTVLFGAHWLTAPGPLSGQGAVFAGLFALLIVAGYLAARVSRRLFPASAAPGSAALSPAPGSAAPSPAAGSAAVGAPAPGAAVASSPWLARLTPLFTVVFAAFLPLAGVLFLLTTTAWTLLERRVFAHYLNPAEPPVTPRPANT
jgi:YidC/Oxa1 family membrane protein insertase